MGLVYKELEDIGKSMYLYFPEQERRRIPAAAECRGRFRKGCARPTGIRGIIMTCRDFTRTMRDI